MQLTGVNHGQLHCKSVPKQTMKFGLSGVPGSLA